MPNQVWPWDIAKLRGPVTYTCYYLYTIDNPYSEAQFKTMKYLPDYPDRFGTLIDARSWARPFFDWYNNTRRHTSLGLMTPATVHLDWQKK